MTENAVTAYIGLGSNLGDRKKHLQNALKMLEIADGINLSKISPFYETKPVGYTEQPQFLNCAAEITTNLTPYELLKTCLHIEEALKRIRTIHWGPRTVDLDILFYGDLVMDDETLTIPHPRIQEREFVLVPLIDIAPGLIHPKLHLTIEELYEKIETGSDNQNIKIFEGDET